MSGPGPRGFSGVFALRAWRVGVYALPIHACYFSMAYLLLRVGPPTGVAQLLLLLVALWAYLAYGVLVNDYFDRGLDIAAGKQGAKRGHGLSSRSMIGLLIVLLVTSAGVVAALNRGAVFDTLRAAAFLVATAYSAPPFRLRRRGVYGFVADTVIEKPFPVPLVFSFFGYYGFEALLFPVLAELLDSVFKHQLEDLESDEDQHVDTLATSVGKERSAKVVSALLDPLNALSVALLVAVPLIAVPAARWEVGSAGAALLLGLFVFWRLRAAGRVRPGFPFEGPPLIGYLNFGFRTLVLGALVVAAVVSHPDFSVVGALAFVSILVYVWRFLPLFADIYRYLRGRGAPA